MSINQLTQLSIDQSVSLKAIVTIVQSHNTGVWKCPGLRQNNNSTQTITHYDVTNTLWQLTMQGAYLSGEKGECRGI